MPDRRRSWARWLTVPLALVGFGVVIAPPPVVRLHVRVNGRPVTVDQPATVAGVLDHADVRPQEGRLLAAVSLTRVDAAADQPTVIRNGEPAAPDDLVHEGDEVATIDGRDWIEAGITSTVPVPFPGLPAVERHVWRPGTDGERRMVVGARSGETVRDTVVVAPEPAREVRGRVVTLSFDDGPNAEWTPQVLDILKRRRVPAVFCVVGEMVDVHPDLVTRIAAEGHRLCDHTVAHPHLEEASPEELAAEIGPTADRVADITGERPAFFRAPYGVFTDEVIESANARGLRVLGWAVDTEDFEQPTPTTLVPALVEAVTPGAVILFHDGGGNRQSTVDALPYVITALRRQGYRFVIPSVDRDRSPAETA